MENTFGKRLANFRKDKQLTQEDMAEQLGVSPQAVSKWENDLSCPDIMLLPQIAELFETSIDSLFREQEAPRATLVPEEKRKNVDKMLLKVIVNSTNGDRVRINIPFALVKMALEIGMNIPQVAGNEYLKDIDLRQIITLVEQGVMGKIVDVQSANGDIVEIVVE